jgi:thioredoxin-dependent peroxiredoxin
MKKEINFMWKQFSLITLTLILLFVGVSMLLPMFTAKPTDVIDRTGYENTSIGKTLPSATFDATGLPNKRLTFPDDWQDLPYRVLIFYPMDQTPGCTIQLCAMRDAYKDFKMQNIVVAGVNSAPLLSHEAFAGLHKLPFPLLVDKDRQLAKHFEIGETMGVNNRTVVVLSAQRGVIWKKEGMPSPQEILTVIHQDQKASS